MPKNQSIPENQMTSVDLPPKPAVKAVFQVVCSVWVIPRYLVYKALHGFFGEDRALCWATESVSKKCGPMGVMYRAAFYERVLRRVGRDVYIGFGTCFSRTCAKLGDNVYIGRRCSVGAVTIGANAHIADGAQLLSGSQHHNAAKDSIQIRHISIGMNAWVGAGAIVMANVGNNACVGAGAVVTRAVGNGVTVTGTPARPIEKVAKHRRVVGSKRMVKQQMTKPRGKSRTKQD